MKLITSVLLSTLLILSGCSKTQEIPDAEIGKDIITWGDSLTQGAGSTDGNNYPMILQQLSSIKVLNEGVSGETSTSIRDRMVRAPKLYKYPVVIWAGRNNYLSPQKVKDDINIMVAKLRHKHYLVLGILNADRETEIKGCNYYNVIKELNADLAATYGDHFIDIRSYLVSEYNTKDPFDIENFNNDVIPHTLRSDNLHLNNAGYNLVAKKIYERINILSAGL